MHPPAIPITSPLFDEYCPTHLWQRALLRGFYVVPALPKAEQPPALPASLDDLAEVACWSTVLLIDPERCRANSYLAAEADTAANARLAARRSACSWLNISVRDPVVREWAEDCQAVTLTLSGPAEAVELARKALGLGGGR